MSATRAAVHVALADLRQRLRSPKYLVVPVLVAWLAQTLTSGRTQLVVAEEYTGVPNAAWIGAMVATMGSLLLFVFGFSLVRGAVTRDRETNVGELVATSPVSDATYVAGRWLGYFTLLSLVTMVLAVATVAGFVLRGTGSFDLWSLVSPFVFLTLPAVALTSAAAVCTEAIRPLRATLGSVLYFVGAMTVFTASVLLPNALYGPTGITIVRNSMVQAVGADLATIESRSFAFTDSVESVTEFTWHGVDWGTAELLSRVPTVAAAVVALAVAVVAFDRFEPSTGLFHRVIGSITSDESETDGAEADSDDTTLTADVDLTPVDPSPAHLPGLHVLAAELRMSLRGQRWWWYLALAGFVGAGFLAPVDTARSLVLPIAWLLGLPIWAGLGVRERRHRTRELVFTSPHPLGQLLAVYLAGVSVALVAASGVLGSLVLSGAFTAVGAVLVGALFVPAMGLASGVWLGTPRAFEATFLTLWYLGPMSALYALDFAGAHPESVARGTPLWVAAATVLLLVAAVVGRSRQVGR